ncbi:PREDICTED: uncharacterized protein LOC104802893 [Tarenaya hassleriana]|uniref:uncharacterized protein LOC104802893 n=1 Tax=Tarenaya hassleriana TaxID=28532 RepID=UPI00053C3346|nr:PREDICTED: uncharacterized protein LOC104802893 [Tarenaya hassleriana]
MEEKEKEMVKFPYHPHPLTHFNNISELECHMCFSKPNSSRIEGYMCTVCFECNLHKECVESPLEIHHHPYHPPHPLSLRPLSPSESSDTCSCCGKRLGRGWVYHCPICSFIIHLRCAKEPPVLEVDQPKSHDHKLFLLPKPRPFTCDACALLLDGPSLPWACLECGVMIHRDCIDLPRLIRISRHPHRIRFTPSPPLPAHESSSLSCGVCLKVAHNQYGAYSCIKDDCRYVVHSKCAIREDVWDGKDLYGVPEEPEDVENPFEVIDDKVIRHFSHEHHHLKLKEDEDDAGFDGSEHCQACGLPIRIHSGNFYGCMTGDCDFVIHETCANLPRKTWYMLHPHRLTLKPCRNCNNTCSVCARDYSGFVYTCCEENCGFQVDANCASISEPFIHIIHPHPLIPASVPTEDKRCSVCRGWGNYNRKMMECIESDFLLCFRCIALPAKVRYKQDRHPLVLEGRGGEGAKGESFWCEICERKLNPDEELYYTCGSCCVTVHVHCILGEDPLIKTGGYSDPWGKFEVVANNSCFRPLCHRCQRRCPFPIVFKAYDHHLCTLTCLNMFLRFRF